MTINANDYELFQLSIYFGQDYDLFFDYDKNKPYIEQAVSAFKKDSVNDPESIPQCIKEIREIQNKNYTDQYLQENLLPEFGLFGDPDEKLNIQEFLEKIVEELER